MSARIHLTSVARITSLQADRRCGTVALGRDLTLVDAERERWRAGDYVVGRVRDDSPLTNPIELPTGRMAPLCCGDLVLGALGRREATLEAVGDWRRIGADGRMELLTGGGLLGKLTSRSDLIPEPVHLEYVGHAAVDERLLRMDDFVVRPPAGAPAFALPVVLVVGSSMSAGKTTTCRALVRLLTALGQRVIAAKVTGAARYRDVLTMADAGAVDVLDFVDVGLPSTVCDPQRYEERLGVLLGRMAAAPADVAVIEAGASPLEPYNGDVALRVLDPYVRCLVLCAADPYAVVGIERAFATFKGGRPDLVSGVVANTQASIRLVEKLSGHRPVDVRSPAAEPQLTELLERALAKPRGRAATTGATT